MKVVFNVVLKLLATFLLYVKVGSLSNVTAGQRCVSGERECRTETSLNRLDVIEGSQNKSTPLMILRRTALKKKRKSDVWKWTYWCQMQPPKGSCKEKVERFYYNNQLDQCAKYLGCAGDRNNFTSIDDCELHCKGATFMTLKNLRPKEICKLQPHSGMCLAMQPMFYYDSNKCKCIKFIYGGCGGNGNRFTSMKECSRECIPMKVKKIQKTKKKHINLDE